MLNHHKRICLIVIKGELILASFLGRKGFSPDQLYIGSVFLALYFGLMLVGSLNNIHRKILIAADRASLVYLSSVLVYALSALVCMAVLPGYGVLGVVLAVTFATLAITAVQFVLLVKSFGIIFFYRLHFLR